MKYTTRQDKKVTVIELSGEIDVSHAPLLKALLQEFIEKQKNQLLIDLGGVSFMDSTGLGIFVNAFKQIQLLGGAIKFANPQEQLRKVFSLTRTDKAFTIFDSVDEGVLSFQ